MQKQSNIKWRSDDYEKLTKNVRKFNAKITRVKKKFPEFAEYFPDRISVTDIREKSTTRADFNREIKKIERFMRGGAEKPIMSELGVKTTEWEKREVSIAMGTINRKRTMERKRMNLSTKLGTMGTVKESNTKKKKFNFNEIPESSWHNFVKNVEKQIHSTYGGERLELYKNNYKKALQGSMGIYADELMELLSQVDSRIFMDAFYQNPALSIDFTYDLTDLKIKYEKIKESLIKLKGMKSYNSETNK